jgi:hypothetical protein
MILLIFIFGLGCASHRPQACKEIEINSAGAYCLDSTRLVGVSTGSGGLGSVANYVMISPSPVSGEKFEDVSTIILMADLPPVTEPSCSEAKDGLRCVASVPNTMLKVIVAFHQPGAGRFIERTQALAKDAGENVIKQWHKK